MIYKGEIDPKYSTLEFSPGTGIIPELINRMYRDGVSDMVTMTQRLPQYLKALEAEQKSATPDFAKYLEQIRKKIENVASYLKG